MSNSEINNREELLREALAAFASKRASTAGLPTNPTVENLLARFLQSTAPTEIIPVVEPTELPSIEEARATYTRLESDSLEMLALSGTNTRLKEMVIDARKARRVLFQLFYPELFVDGKLKE